MLNHHDKPLHTAPKLSKEFNTLNESEINAVLRDLLEYARAGKLISEPNGYEADENPITGTSYTVCHIPAEDDDRPTALRIEENGEIKAWATVNDADHLLEVKNPYILIHCHSLI